LRSFLSLLVSSIVLCLLAVVASAAVRPAAAEESSKAADAYLEFRRWINAQSEEVRSGDELAAYRKHLAAQGLNSEEIEQRIELLDERLEIEEVEFWNRVLTAEEPRFNTEPNAFLVRVIEGRTPGRALDVGMGQGRNAIWLAGQGWEVTGFDPAEKAVALAHELADEAGVTIATETVGSEEFDWGSEQWDLVVLSYVSAREWIETIHRCLRPRGLVMLEAFHEDATENGSIGSGVVFETNELLELFSGFRILDYEDTAATSDFGMRETRVVRLFAMKK
jgi:2-polyprenyl-3-methyl-5-hydroxy-6-metoxy-1,4-benzoquinol methylase